MRVRFALILVLAALLAGCGDNWADTPWTAASTTTVAPSTTAAVDPVVGAEPYIWIPVEGSASAFGGSGAYSVHAEGLAAGDLGYVAVGYEIEEYGDTGTYHNTGCVVWFSSDGVDWARLGYTGQSGKNWMHAVLAGGPGFIAVGETSMGDADAAVWTSADGSQWTQSWTSPEDGDQEMRAVTAGGPGFVAVGQTYPEDVDAAVWVSSDGVSWDRVDGGGAFGGPGNQTMYDVVAGGPGLVAVGFEETPEGYDGAVWVSPDGTDWSRVADPEGVLGGPGSQVLEAVVAGGPGLVAFGVEEYADQVVWSSPDGMTWARETPGSIVSRGPGGDFVDIATGPSGPAAFWDGQIWLGVPCSAPDDLIASLADRAGGTADDSACPVP